MDISKTITRGLVITVSEEDKDLLDITPAWTIQIERKRDKVFQRVVRCIETKDEQGKRKKRVERLARIILERVRGPIPYKYLVHHRNDNTLDLRRENLDAITYAQNTAYHSNMPSSTGYRGVQKKTKTLKSGKTYTLYEARITNQKEHTYIKCFTTPEEAAIAYNIKAQDFFGDYAVLNSVPQEYIEKYYDEVHKRVQYQKRSRNRRKDSKNV